MNRFTSTGLLAFSLALIAIAPAAHAQQVTDPSGQVQEPSGRHHARRDPHKAAMHLSKKLGLSSDQTAKLEPILADRQQKMEALRADTSISKQQRHEQMRSIRQNTEQQMSAVLTPEQMGQLKSMHKEHHHRGAAAPTGA